MANHYYVSRQKKIPLQSNNNKFFFRKNQSWLLSMYFHHLYFFSSVNQVKRVLYMQNVISHSSTKFKQLRPLKLGCLFHPNYYIQIILFAHARKNHREQAPHFISRNSCVLFRQFFHAYSDWKKMRKKPSEKKHLIIYPQYIRMIFAQGDLEFPIFFL